MLKKQKKKKIINNQEVACFQADLQTWRPTYELSWKAEYLLLQFSSKENLKFCKAYLKFEDKIKSSKNYNPSFVEGCLNFRKSAIVERVKTEMHNKACEFEDMEKAQELGEKYKKNYFNSKYTH